MAAPTSGRAAGLSLVLFAGVVIVSPAWREIPALAGALVASLVILPIYFAVLLRKLTNAIARAEEASRAKSHFLAAMSHELRTPLNAIIGMSELLATTRLDREQRDMTATVRTPPRSLLGLVDQVLDLAKIEERRFAVEIEPFDLHDSLARLRLPAGPSRCGAKGSPCACASIRRRRGGCAAAPRQLHQVLVNLVGNAIKFTDRGAVTIRVGAVALGRWDGAAALRRRGHGHRPVARGTGASVRAFRAQRRERAPGDQRQRSRPQHYPRAGAADGRYGRHDAASLARAPFSGSSYPSPKIRRQSRSSGSEVGSS